jgi:hypothetical protein
MAYGKGGRKHGFTRHAGSLHSHLRDGLAGIAGPQSLLLNDLSRDVVTVSHDDRRPSLHLLSTLNAYIRSARSIMSNILVIPMASSRPLIRIALFRNDLRIHDQPLLHAATNDDGKRKVHLLPLYCFDPRQYDMSPLNGRVSGLGPFEPAKTWHFAFPRAAEHKTR